MNKEQQRSRKRKNADRPVTVYAAGKVRRARKGQRAGDFGTIESDFMVRTLKSAWKLVGSDYALRTGDTLVVTTRGVAGANGSLRENGFAGVARRSIQRNREVLLALAKL